MGTTLATLSPPKGARKKRKRKGRGPGSGNGTTAGKGYKGQKSRSGIGGLIVGFEGGQMPLQRRLPKRGFKNYPFRVEFHGVNIGRLAIFEAGSTVDLEMLKKNGIAPRSAARVKILGDGELPHQLTVKVQGFSKSARAKIEAAGGTVEIVAAAKRIAKRLTADAVSE